MLDEMPKPTEEDIREYLAGNLCRCGCYGEIMQAVRKAAGL
jgi:aerobic-type carbon monoxide dehydrogenase small subunit (CoxS/CutS family)